LSVAADFAVRYLADPDPAPGPEQNHEEDKAPTFEPDSYSKALNAVRSTAVRTLVDLALYEHEKIVPPRQPGPVGVRAAEQLSTLLTPRRDRSGAVAAAFGEAYGKILSFAPGWIEQHRNELLSADDFGDVVVTTALVIYRTSLALLESLTPNIVDLISRASRGDRIVEGWKVQRTPLEQIGDHLMLMWLWGEYDLDSPLVDQFFREAAPDTRASVLGHIGWLLLGDAEIPGEILSRAQQLVDARASNVAADDPELAEFGQFFWWVHCGKFPDEWWLPHLARASTGTEVHGRSYLGDHLAEVARKNPRVTIDVFAKLLQSARQPLACYSLLANAPEILSCAIDCGDPAAAKEALELIDWLGKVGYLEIKDRVDDARNGDPVT
jgi:hypothetical protein